MATNLFQDSVADRVLMQNCEDTHAQASRDPDPGFYAKGLGRDVYLIVDNFRSGLC